MDKKINYNYGKYSSFSFNNNTLNDVKTEEFNDIFKKKYIENKHHFFKINESFADKIIENKIKMLEPI